MTMLNAGLNNIGILDAGVVALLGYCVVFFGLILLMIVVMIIGKCFTAAENKKKADLRLQGCFSIFTGIEPGALQ